MLMRAGSDQPEIEPKHDRGIVPVMQERRPRGERETFRVGLAVSATCTTSISAFFLSVRFRTEQTAIPDSLGLCEISSRGRPVVFQPNSQSSATPSKWRPVYDCAIRELDDAKSRERIAEARNATLDRAEQILTDPASEERVALKHALRTLKLLDEAAVKEKKAA
jgi:hypothetical protein